MIKLEKIFWTKHSRNKMRQYGFSEKRVLRILRKPDRREEGIAPGTIAAMQITGTKKHPTEAWVMYQIINPKSKAEPSESEARRGSLNFVHLTLSSAIAERSVRRETCSLRTPFTSLGQMNAKRSATIQNSKLRIISAWRYPGRTPEKKRPIIPEDTLAELDKILKE